MRPPHKALLSTDGGAPMGDAEKGLTAFPIKEEEGEVYVKLAR